MRSERALWLCMQALVLLDLVFVQRTGAAGLRWTVPLFALALGAGVLVRLREHTLYRWLWNGGVLGFFLVLVRHALQADLAYVLEDGLVLAALCQVHLLNNLRSDQRPDLLFFNAFLIAIVTGFLDRRLGFALVFLAFAPAFVIGLELLSGTRDGRALSPAGTARLARDGARRALALLALSGLAFLLVPRDFERKPLFHGTFELAGGDPDELVVGFNESLVLERGGRVGAESRPALRVRLLEGERSAVAELWRGATLGETEGGSWYPLEPAARRQRGAGGGWRRDRGGLAKPGAPARGAARVLVERFAQDTERLFAPLEARALRLAPESAGVLVRPSFDGTLEASDTGQVAYELVLDPPARPRLGGARAVTPPAELAPYVLLPDDERVASARALAARLAQRTPADAEQHVLVAALRAHLERSFAWLPPGTDGAADTLDAFLRGEGGGHCEFFASALATMLRSLGVPCRVVTGFRASRWDAGASVLSVGSLDAHAWVEVHDPRAGWYAVDPSPAPAVQPGGAGAWARLAATARAGWEGVTGFDAGRRAAALAWVRALPGRVGGALGAGPLAALLLALALLPVVWIERRRRARTPAAVRAYARALRRAGLRPRPGETPRELLARGRLGRLEPESILELVEATERHEARRYAA